MDLASTEVGKARDYSSIGYYGRPISELNRDELLAALVELAELYKECKWLNYLYQEILATEQSV